MGEDWRAQWAGRRKGDRMTNDTTFGPAAHLQAVTDRYRKAWAAERAAQARIEAAEAEVVASRGALIEISAEHATAKRALLEAILGESSNVRR